MKKGLLVLLAVLLALTFSMPVSLADDAVTVSARGEFPIVDKEITLTFYKEGAISDADAAKLHDNGVIKYIRDTTGINMEFVYINSAEGKQKMSLDFAGGTYPDGALLDWGTLFTRDNIMQYGVKEGIIIPLNDYIDQYGLELNKILEMRPLYKGMITAPDGKIYGLPRFTECYHCMSYPKLWFNYAWMEKLGLSEPQTTEELYNVLKAFKEKDPNGNGQADEIPLTGGIEYSEALEYYLMNSFISTPAASTPSNPRTFLSWIDGKVQFVADKPQYKDGLTWIKKLYDEGLIDPANFTQGSEGLSQVVRTDPMIVGGYTCDHMGMGIDFNNQETSAMFHALPPVAGPEGVRVQPLQDGATQMSGFHFALFDKCSNPAAAYRLADFLLSEYMMFVGHYGIEGITWNPPEDPEALNIQGGPLKCVVVKLPEDAPQDQKDLLANNGFWTGFMGDLIERRAMWSPAVSGPDDPMLLTNYESRLDWETQRTDDYWPERSLPGTLFMEQDLSDEFAELLTNINSHVQKNTAMFITGARSLDEWDAYLAELKQFGVDRYLEIYTDAYAQFQANLEK